MNRITAQFALLVLLAVGTCGLGSATAATAADDPRIDQDGRAAGVWAPPRHFDHLHMRLEIDIPDMESKRFTALQTLKVKAQGSIRSRLVLNAREKVKIEAVTVNGAAAKFAHADGHLTIELPVPANPGEELSVETRYTADEPSREGVGLNWFKGRPDRDPPQAAQIHSQGQAECNSYWFPCHDFPNERLTTELIVTVPEGFEVLSNGRRVADETAAGRRTVHWLQDKPHPNYLVTLVVGQFDSVELGGPESARPGLPMPVFGPPGSKDDLARVFGATPRMVAFFERYFDEPYPWDQYAQVIVRHFRWGGMENTSCSTLNDMAPGSKAGSEDDLISHELAHQWTGNLLTCKTWEHLWLNEGFATLAEWLWIEERDGPEAYTKAVRRALGMHSMTNMASAPAFAPMASNRYVDPDDLFTRPDDVYAKGGLVLHMLRRRLGPEVFRKGVALYIDQHRFSEVETDDLRKALEEVSGESLQRFFDQWTKQPGLPRLNISVEWDEGDKAVVAQIEQTQTINGDNPAFAFALPLHAVMPDGSVRVLDVAVDGKNTAARFVLGSKPKIVEVDPQIHVAAAKITKGGLVKPAREPKTPAKSEP